MNEIMRILFGEAGNDVCRLIRSVYRAYYPCEDPLMDRPYIYKVGTEKVAFRPADKTHLPRDLKMPNSTIHR